MTPKLVGYTKSLWWLHTDFIGLKTQLVSLIVAITAPVQEGSSVDRGGLHALEHARDSRGI